MDFGIWTTIFGWSLDNASHNSSVFMVHWRTKKCSLWQHVKLRSICNFKAFEAHVLDNLTVENVIVYLLSITSWIRHTWYSHITKNRSDTLSEDSLDVKLISQLKWYNKVSYHWGSNSQNTILRSSVPAGISDTLFSKNHLTDESSSNIYIMAEEVIMKCRRRCFHNGRQLLDSHTGFLCKRQLPE